MRDRNKTQSACDEISDNAGTSFPAINNRQPQQTRTKNVICKASSSCSPYLLCPQPLRKGGNNIYQKQVHNNIINNNNSQMLFTTTSADANPERKCATSANVYKQK